MGGPRALALAFSEMEKLRRTNAGQQRNHCTTNTATTTTSSSSSSSNTATTTTTTSSSNSTAPKQNPQIAKLRGVKLRHNRQGHKKAHIHIHTRVYTLSTHTHPSFNLALYMLFLFCSGKRASVHVPGQGCFLHCCSETGRLIK